jgi:hypothetical protein
MLQAARGEQFGDTVGDMTLTEAVERQALGIAGTDGDRVELHSAPVDGCSPPCISCSGGAPASAAAAALEAFDEQAGEQREAGWSIPAASQTGTGSRRAGTSMRRVLTRSDSTAAFRPL